MSRMSGDNVESLLKTGGNMRLAFQGTLRTIDINEGEMNADTKGR